MIQKLQQKVDELVRQAGDKQETNKKHWLLGCYTGFCVCMVKKYIKTTYIIIILHIIIKKNKE